MNRPSLSAGLLQPAVPTASKTGYNTAAMTPAVSIAIETSCRMGAVALGRDGKLRRCIDFDASARHATQLVGRLAELLRDASLCPAELSELYVSAGPGSFTGVRVGMTVARTMGHMLGDMRCVAVPTPLAIAWRSADMPGHWKNLAVVLDARDEYVHVSMFRRDGGQIVPQDSGRIVTVSQFLAEAPRPITVTGEGLAYHDCSSEGISIADEAVRLPTAQSVWQAGRRMAQTGQYTDPGDLRPIYARPPEAVRLWDDRGSL